MPPKIVPLLRKWQNELPLGVLRVLADCFVPLKQRPDHDDIPLFQ